MKIELLTGVVRLIFVAWFISTQKDFPLFLPIGITIIFLAGMNFERVGRAITK